MIELVSMSKPVTVEAASVKLSAISTSVVGNVLLKVASTLLMIDPSLQKGKQNI